MYIDVFALNSCFSYFRLLWVGFVDEGSSVSREIVEILVIACPIQE